MVTNDALLKEHKVNTIIWAAILASLVFYVVICLALAPGIQQDLSKETLGFVVVFLSVGLFGAAYPIRRNMARFQLRNLQDGQPQQLAIAQYRKHLVVSLALAEAIGINGLILFILGLGEFAAYLLFAFSAFVQVLFRPRLDELESFVVRALDKDAA